MSHPLIPAVTETTTTESAAKVLEEIRGKLGQLPLAYSTAAHSPTTLESLWELSLAGSRLSLPAHLQEAIGDRVAQLHGNSNGNGSLSAGATPVFKEALTSREHVTLGLVTKIVKDKGHHAVFVVEAARQVGVTNQEIVEVIALIALHTWTNLLYSVANTCVDHPAGGHPAGDHSPRWKPCKD